MHTQADQACGEPTRSSSQRDRNPLWEYMRTRGSRFLNAIRGLGGCAPQWRGYEQPAMDPSRASHSRRSSSARDEPVWSQSLHRSSASARHVSCSGDEAEECTQPPAPEQFTLGSLAPPATMTPPAAASTHQEDVVDCTQQTPCWSDTNAFDWAGAMQASATFTDLLGGQSSQDLDEPGRSHWYQHGEPSAHWTPSEHVLGPSTLPHEDPSAWYMQGRVSGAGYTFGGVPIGHADDDEDDQGHARQGPAQAAGMRATHPPDAYTPGDCVRHRRR
ncbi:uncharacterized protein LOC133905329 [Phragmites australis]|uniref:uncharacterized protein LOC133905329 n=1 Tax=Phragmites australis TaxID=29695 RepID=UPI002D7A3B6C|nr:uncharacterized protein LOC133905329 [Phragmites australis]